MPYVGHVYNYKPLTSFLPITNAAAWCKLQCLCARIGTTGRGFHSFI